MDPRLVVFPLLTALTVPLASNTPEFEASTAPEHSETRRREAAAAAERVFENTIKVMSFNIHNYEDGFWARGLVVGQSAAGLFKVGNPPSQSTSGNSETLKLLDRSDMDMAVITVGKRVARIVEIIKAERPAVVGLQEAYPDQAILLAGLLGYKRYGRGRDNGSTTGAWSSGETSTILWDPEQVHQDTLAVVMGSAVPDRGTFWFSSEPDEPGSTPWGTKRDLDFDGPPRVCSWVRLVVNATGREFYVYNLHLSTNSNVVTGDGPLTRLKSVDLLTERIEDRASEAPVIVTGDFNSSDGSTVIDFMTRRSVESHGDTWWNPHPLRDAHAYATDGTSCNRLTGRLSGSRIDYIFVPMTAATTGATILTDYPGNVCPSDHAPITARVRIPPPTRNPLYGLVDGDDRTDLIFVGDDWSGNGLNIRTKLSKGDGTWDGKSQVLGDGSGVLAYPPHIGDVDGDKKADLILVGQNWDGSGLNVRVKLSNGDGTWTAKSQILSDGSGVHTYPTRTGDVNGDGKTDLIFIGRGWDGDGLNVRVKLSNGDGTWTENGQVLGDGPGVHTHPSLTGDVNSDGKTDLIFVGQKWSGSGLNVRVKLSNGDGTWTEKSQVLGDGAGVHDRSTLVGDVNKDGRSDLIFVGHDWSGDGLNVRTKISNGDGTWTAASQVLGDGPGVHTYATLAGDVDGDKQTDLVFLGHNWSGNGLNVRTKLSKGDGTWTAKSQVLGDGAGVHRYSPGLQDVNGDRKADLIFVGSGWSGPGLNVRVKLSNGDGTWSSHSQVLGDGPGVLK
jgi:endonuclease/exonuclease/phosphatase family metal-dependent hydrolase